MSPAPPTSRVAAVLRSLGSLLPEVRRRRVSTSGRPLRADFNRQYPTIGLAPAQLRAILQGADAGQPRAQFELFAEMLQKWPRLAAVERTRRLALTGLDWDMAPDEDATPVRNRSLATAAADYCRTVLRQLTNLPAVLDHLATATGYGLALAELVWERGRLMDIVPVPATRLLSDHAAPWRLRVLTDEHPLDGVALDRHPSKWIVHQPQQMPGRRFDNGLLRVSALLFLAQNLSFKDWLIYSQIAGMPVRIAQFDQGTSEAEQQRLLQMLQALNSDAVAVVNKGVELKFVEAARGADRPYAPLQEYCNTEVTILWLGQHLTTDLRANGSRAAAEVHDRVREDLLAADLADEAATLRRDLLAPLVRARFGDGTPVPHFRRALVQTIDTRQLCETLATAVERLGLPVPQRWAYQALGIPAPQVGEATIPGREP